MLTSVLVVALAAAPALRSPLERAIGMHLPYWGARVAQLERDYPGLQEHQPHECPNETWDPKNRELRKPDLSVSGMQVQFIDFLQGPRGLESIKVELPMGGWHSNGARLSSYLEQHLGPATERRSAHHAIWRSRQATVVAYGTAIFIVEPGSESERATLEGLARLEALRSSQAR
jgi:hypothetical protein